MPTPTPADRFRQRRCVKCSRILIRRYRPDRCQNCLPVEQRDDEETTLRLALEEPRRWDSILAQDRRTLAFCRERCRGCPIRARDKRAKK